MLKFSASLTEADFILYTACAFSVTRFILIFNFLSLLNKIDTPLTLCFINNYNIGEIRNYHFEINK